MKERAEMCLMDVPEALASAMLLTSDGVVAPLLSLALSLSLVEGVDDFEKPRWVSLSSEECPPSAGRREEKTAMETLCGLADQLVAGRGWGVRLRIFRVWRPATGPSLYAQTKKADTLADFDRLNMMTMSRTTETGI